MVGLAIASGTGLSTRAARARSTARRGFSLIELVIVVVIIGIIAAIAVPRMSRGSQGAGESALTANLQVLRNAVDLYQTEHMAYPASASGATGTILKDQLTLYSNGTGATSSTKDAVNYPYGPYLRKLPKLPVGSKKGAENIRIAASAGETPGGGASTDGWVYYPATGEVKADLPSSETDAAGVAYNAY